MSVAPHSATPATLPPGPRLPRAGQTLAWTARPTQLMERCRARYGDTFTLRFAHGETWVFLSHPDAIKQVFTGDPRLLHAGEANEVLRPVLGDRSVLLLDESAHMQQRKLMLPPLHGERMQRYGELMAEAAAREVETWPVGVPTRVLPGMQRVTLEVIMRAVFGVAHGERSDRLRSAVRGLLAWTTDRRQLLVLAALGPSRVRGNQSFAAAIDPVHRLLVEEIERRRRDPALAERDDILSLLVQARHEDGSAMSDVELRDELMTLLLAGHETTATSLAWTIELLMRHPAALERLTEEVRSGDDAFLDAVIKEALRIRPVIPVVLRLLKEPMEIGGWELPAGVAVAPCIYLVHRRPDVYPEPDRFIPERFLDRAAATYTWIPFGGGVRRCLGASFAQFEIAAVLPEIVGRLSLRPARRRPERVSRRAISFAPSRGTEVIVEGREGVERDAPRPREPAHAA
jgi:cytochrome P450 family 135